VRQAVVVVIVALAAAVPAARLKADSPTSGATAETSRSTGTCSGERWTVKTLQDRPRLLPARKTTVHFLVTRPAPARLPDTRLPFERHVFTVTATVTLIIHPADGDLHMVLWSGGDHMIAEAPSPSCLAGATPLRREQMTRARANVRICATARVTGVAFFDIKHGQPGVAPNAIELHPILAFACLSQ
jgi:hypothetical protein